MVRRVEWQLLTQVEAAYWACFRYPSHELRPGNEKVCDACHHSTDLPMLRCIHGCHTLAQHEGLFAARLRMQLAHCAPQSELSTGTIAHSPS